MKKLLLLALCLVGCSANNSNNEEDRYKEITKYDYVSASLDKTTMKWHIIYKKGQTRQEWDVYLSGYSVTYYTSTFYVCEKYSGGYDYVLEHGVLRN